jgi:hypothetical protein
VVSLAVSTPTRPRAGELPAVRGGSKYGIVKHQTTLFDEDVEDEAGRTGSSLAFRPV